MSRKTLNVEALTNELQGASLFFQKPKPTPPLVGTRQSRVIEGEQSVYAVKNERPNERTIERTNVRKMEKAERVKVRHSFDVYKDQLVELQALQLTAVRRGKRKPKLGDLVQQAIDLYLSRKKG